MDKGKMLGLHSNGTARRDGEIGDVALYGGSGTEADPYVVEFDDNDRQNPMTWSSAWKWTYNILAALTMMTGTFSVSSYTSGAEGMAAAFGISAEVAAVGQTTFLCGMGFGSLVFPGTAGHFGRKKVIVSTMLVFAAFSMGVAAATNIATVIICRFFAGLAGAASQALIPAQTSSLWAPKDLAVPFTTAAIAPFLGPSLGPLLGGYVTEYTGDWRNVNWLAAGMAASFGLAYLFIVPETLGPYILRQRARQLQSKHSRVYVSVHDMHMTPTTRHPLVDHVKRPVQFLLFEPVVTIFTFYISFLFGVLNLFFAAFPRIYQYERGWTQGNAGLPYIALILGFIISIPATILCGIPYKKAIQETGTAPPELRLPFAIISSVLLPISLFWIGWTGTPSVSWVSPVIAGGVFGFAQIGLQMSAFTYLADLYGIQVGAAFAAMNFVRFNLSAIFPLFARQMYARLGTAWASSVLGFILIAFLPAPTLFYVSHQLPYM